MSRNAFWASPCRLLFLGLLVAGLFAMHGLQSTGTPLDVHGVPLMAAPAAGTGGMTAGTEGMATGTGAMAAGRAGLAPHPPARLRADHPAAAPSGAAHGESGGDLASRPDGDPHRHGHPGDRMCLGLLVIASLLTLLTVLVGGHSARRTTLRSTPLPRGGHGPRPPPAPSIYALSVLRL